MTTTLIQPAPKVSKRPKTKGLTAKQQALKDRLDALALRYAQPAFVADDPLSFAHRFADDKANCELVAFIAALFSYGRRDLILKTVENLLDRMDGDPRTFVGAWQKKRAQKAFGGFVYRFNRAEDLVYLTGQLGRLLDECGSLQGAFEAGVTVDGHMGQWIGRFTDLLLAGADEALQQRYGMKFLLAHPARGAACKRMNMFLRWMVRNDALDLGLWHCTVQPSHLMMPLDTHVATIGRELGLITRNANDWQTVEALTAELRRFCPEDPVRYDVALFGYGVERSGSRSKSQV